MSFCESCGTHFKRTGGRMSILKASVRHLDVGSAPAVNSKRFHVPQLVYVCCNHADQYGL